MDQGVKSESSGEVDPYRMMDKDEQYVGLCKNIRVLIPQIGLARGAPEDSFLKGRLRSSCNKQGV